jgi:hypothetical protein
MSGRSRPVFRDTIAYATSNAALAGALDLLHEQFEPFGWSSRCSGSMVGEDLRPA